ncbi:MAG: hypothetical protein BAJATHORv1_30203 [Candidatus Thorarchaeota archaeon]|nr:MAG: hypothetical protein BAJATHORv1_30203 [Candidatus Thorarchaeota archaeon]
MKEYSSGISRTVSTLVIIAIIISSGILVIALMQSNGNITTTPTTPSNGDFGAMAVEYIESRRDDVIFYWTCNNTLVNEDITTYYQQTEPSAFVDGIYINQTSTGADISVLFAPYSSDLIGEGSIDQTTYESLNGDLLNNGIGKMEAASTHPNDFPSSWPIDLYMYIFFDDDSFFFIGYTSDDGMVFIQNGTWSGFRSNGHPDVTGYIGNGYWLVEDGHLNSGMTALYTTVTNNVDYPEA